MCSYYRTALCLRHATTTTRPSPPKSSQQQHHNPSANKKLQLRVINTPAGSDEYSLSCLHLNICLSVMNTLLRSLMTSSMCKHVSGSTFLVNFKTHPFFKKFEVGGSHCTDDAHKRSLRRKHMNMPREIKRF